MMTFARVHVLCVLVFYSHEETLQHTLSETVIIVTKLKQSFLVRLQYTCHNVIVIVCTWCIVRTCMCYYCILVGSVQNIGGEERWSI